MAWGDMPNVGGLHNTNYLRRSGQVPSMPQQESAATSGRTGWEARRQGLLDDAMQRYGLSQFIKGGAYDPETILSVYQSNMGAAPQTQAPSAAMDLASRGAAAQAGASRRSLLDRQTNPAALAAIMGSIAQQASAGVGSAGLSGMQSGLDVLSRHRLANQSALLQDRGTQAGLFDSALGRAYGAGQFGAGNLMSLIENYWNQRYAEQQRKQGMWGNALGSLAGKALGAYLPGLGGANMMSGMDPLFPTGDLPVGPVVP